MLKLIIPICLYKPNSWAGKFASKMLQSNLHRRRLQTISVCYSLSLTGNGKKKTWLNKAKCSGFQQLCFPLRAAIRSPSCCCPPSIFSAPCLVHPFPSAPQHLKRRQIRCYNPNPYGSTTLELFLPSLPSRLCCCYFADTWGHKYTKEGHNCAQHFCKYCQWLDSQTQVNTVR